MAEYIPKVDDVFMDGKGFVRYVVTGIDSAKHTADVMNVAGVIDVRWTMLGI